MIIKCFKCGTDVVKSPSKVYSRTFCSKECYAIIRDKEIAIKGNSSRFQQGHKHPQSWFKIMKDKMTGEKHFAWKGEKVGYRGLHYWLRRKLGDPTKCQKCNKVSTEPHAIHWANIDGRYRRVLSGYFPLCTICHKNYDIKLRATLGVPKSTKLFDVKNLQS